MRRIYTYRLRTILRSKAGMFWTLGFPFVMAVFFSLSFGGLAGRIETFEPISVAYLSDRENPSFEAMLTALSEGEQPLLQVETRDPQAAKEMLDKGKINGIILYEEELTLEVSKKGLSQSILRNVLNQYRQSEDALYKIMETNPQDMDAVVQAMVEQSVTFETVQLSKGSLNFTTQNFYALIAMACLYGGGFGLHGIVASQANQSALGARRSASPTGKLQQIVGDLLAAMTVVFIEVVALILFIRFILKVPVGSQVGPVLLLCLMGTASGVMLGMVLGAVLKWSANAKEGLQIALNLFLSFLGGLMYWNMRFLVEKYAPLVNRINPVALLVDGFYTLETYGVTSRYWENIVFLGLFTLAAIGVCVVSLRRNQYASI